ncbi:MAG: DMT family transporter [Burkholderiales bacterium]
MESHPRHLLRGVSLILTAVFLFSSMDTVAKYVLKSYPLPPLVWARNFTNLLFILVLVWPRMRNDLFRTAHPWLQVLRGLLLVSSTTFFYLSLKFMPLAEAAAISFVGPVLVTALSGPLLGEKVSRRQWFAVVLGFIGVLVIIRPTGSVFSPSVAFPIICAVFFSLYQIATRKVAGREDPYTTACYTALVGSAATSLALPFTWQTPTLLQGGLMFVIGFFGGLGHLFLIRAVTHASPMALAPFVYVQLIWSTLLAWIAFGDFPDEGTLTGMGIIVAAGLLAVNWKHMRRQTDATEQASTH